MTGGALGSTSQAEWAADTKRQPKNFAAIDTNGDGQIDAAETDARTAKRFARMDADGNGIVTREEQQAVNKPSSN